MNFYLSLGFEIDVMVGLIELLINVGLDSIKPLSSKFGL
jgi:hypothetical protein